MPDLDELLRDRLDRPLAVALPPLEDLQHRASRRRQKRWAAVAAGAAAGITLLVAGTSIPWPTQDRDVSGYAAGVRDGVLDAGTGRDGPWRVLVNRDDGWCVKQVRPTGESGACQLATPGRLDEASQFPTWDGDEYVVVVAGPAPPSTNRIEVTAQGRTAVATITEVDGRLFWSARVPPGEGGTWIVAYDSEGAVAQEVTWPPVPDAPVPYPVPPPTLEFDGSAPAEPE